MSLRTMEGRQSHRALLPLAIDAWTFVAYVVCKVGPIMPSDPLD